MKNRTVFLMFVGALVVSLVLTGCPPRSEETDTDEPNQAAAPAEDSGQADTDEPNQAAAPAEDSGQTDTDSDSSVMDLPSDDLASAGSADTGSAGTADSQPTPWNCAQVGDVLVYEMQGGATRRVEVVDMDDENVYVDTIMTMGDMVANQTEREAMPRYAQVLGTHGENRSAPGAQVEQLPAETITISGNDYVCQVTQVTQEANGQTMVSKAWTCDEIPGGIVKSELNSSVTMELIEFTRGQ